MKEKRYNIGKMTNQEAEEFVYWLDMFAPRQGQCGHFEHRGKRVECVMESAYQFLG